MSSSTSVSANVNQSVPPPDIQGINTAGTVLGPDPNSYGPYGWNGVVGSGGYTTGYVPAGAPPGYFDPGPGAPLSSRLFYNPAYAVSPSVQYPSYEPVTQSTGTTYKPGPNYTLYNGGVDMGPQTASPAPYANTTSIPWSYGNTVSEIPNVSYAPPSSGYMQPSTSYSVGPNDPSGLLPFTNTSPNNFPGTMPSSGVQQTAFDQAQNFAESYWGGIPGALVPQYDPSVMSGYQGSIPIRF